MRVVLYGVGDLGERAAYLLAAVLQTSDTLVVAGRHADTVHQVAAMAAMVALSRGDGPRVQEAVFALEPDEARRALVHHAPDALIFCATRFSWWRAALLPSSTRDALANAGFGVWLATQADLPLRLTPVLASLAKKPWLVLGPYPDVVAPLVKSRGWDRVLGFGNVDELAMLTQRAHPGRAVKLVAHHSVEAHLFGDGRLPPYRLFVDGGGGHWEPAELARPFDWPSGTRSHVFTAASLVRTLRALFGSQPSPIHVPGPRGLPGGYPCVAGGGKLELALPPGVTLAETLTVNREGQRADGIACIDDDGTVWLTADAQTGLQRAFGLSWDRLAPGSMTALADELAARLNSDGR